MKMPITESAERQPWQPSHWVTMSGYALSPADLRYGTTKCVEARDMTRAILDTDLIIRKAMRP